MKGAKTGVIYLKSIVAGLLAVIAAAILLVIVVAVGFWAKSDSSQTETGSLGWDPIALAKPFTWLVVVLGIFLVGFFWEFFRAYSKWPTPPD